MKKPPKKPPTRKTKPKADVAPKRKPHAKQRSLELDDRRTEVAALYVKGYYQVEIATALGISKFQVYRDLKAIEAEWAEARQDDLQLAKQKELHKLEQVEREAWRAWNRSQDDAVTEKKTAGMLDGKEESVELSVSKLETTRVGQVGDARFLEQVLRVSERRCKILGLDAPAKIQTSGEFMTRDQMIAELIAAVGQ